MPINVQDLPSKEVNVLNKNTGFPEPLSPDRNTTLPHPDADTSPSATIEAPDIDLTRTVSRSSFLHRRHQSKNSFSKGDMKGSSLYDNMQYSNGTQETANTRTLDAKSPKEGNTSDPLSQDNGGVDGVLENRDEQGYAEGQRKKGVLRKLNLHKF